MLLNKWIQNTHLNFLKHYKYYGIPRDSVSHLNLQCNLVIALSADLQRMLQSNITQSCQLFFLST